MPVYFLRAGENGPVKIGTAAQPLERIKSFQTGHYEPLHLLRVIAGSRGAEGKLHRHYAERRVRAEWFEFCPSMLTIKISDHPRAQRAPRPVIDRSGTLAEIIGERGCRQIELARLCGVAAPVMSKWANRKCRIPPRVLRPLATALGVPIEEIIEVAEPAQHQT